MNCQACLSDVVMDAWEPKHPLTVFVSWPAILGCAKEELRSSDNFGSRQRHRFFCCQDAGFLCVRATDDGLSAETGRLHASGGPTATIRNDVLLSSAFAAAKAVLKRSVPSHRHRFFLLPRLDPGSPTHATWNIARSHLRYET